MVDIINAHVPYYDNLVLITGFFNPREIPLNSRVKVKLCKAYNRNSSISRFLSWVVFWLQSLYYTFILYRTYKVYFVSNPPINVFTARCLKRPFGFLVYDIYPEALSRYRYINRKSVLYRHWIKTNHKVYNRAELLITISKGMKKAMLNWGIDEQKIKIVPVWTNSEFFTKIPAAENLFLKANGIKGKFIVGYSGNLGKSHPLEKIVELANLLKEEQDIDFLIIGKGDKKSRLKALIEENALTNVRLLNYQETQLYPHVLAAFDMGVITLDAKASDLNVPSKIYNLMSAGRTVMGISSEASELAKIISENEIGKNFDKDNLSGMKDFIMSLKRKPERHKRMQNNAFKTSLKYTSDNANRMLLK